MIRTQLLALIAMVALACGAAGAQNVLTVRPESRVTLLGKSNVNSWACASSVFDVSIVVDSSARHDTISRVAVPTIRLAVRVPVRSLNCGRKRMNDEMYRVLKADEYPDIRYVLDTYMVDSTRSASDSFTVHSIGALTVAGKTHLVPFQVRGQRGIVGLQGEAIGHILMTDFGIKPPTALLGAIRTRNALVIRVDMLVARSYAAIPTR